MVAAFESNVEILEMSATNTSTLLPVSLYHVSISYEEFSEAIAFIISVTHLESYIVLYVIQLL